MNKIETDAMEKILAAALRGRSDPVPSCDLAVLAIERARVMEVNEIRLGRLARLSRWTRTASIAAAVLIAAILAVGYTRLPVSIESDAATTASTTTVTIDWTTVGAAAFVAALIAVALVALMAPERPQVRLSPA